MRYFDPASALEDSRLENDIGFIYDDLKQDKVLIGGSGARLLRKISLRSRSAGCGSKK
jgi:hypothetical protein